MWNILRLQKLKWGKWNFYYKYFNLTKYPNTCVVCKLYITSVGYVISYRLSEKWAEMLGELLTDHN